MCDIFFEILLSLFVNPLLKIMEIERIWVLYLPCKEPFVVKSEIISDFLSIEDSVYHVAAKQSQLDLVACMRVNLLVFVDSLEYVGSG